VAVKKAAKKAARKVNREGQRWMFKPVGRAKPSPTRSGGTSKGGKTGEKERGLRRQTPFEKLGS
jgi:hypothetical protein